MGTTAMSPEAMVSVWGKANIAWSHPEEIEKLETCKYEIYMSSIFIYTILENTFLFFYGYYMILYIHII